MSDFPIKVGDSTNIDTYVTSLIHGEEQLLITRDGNLHLTKGNGTKIDLSDVEFVDTLPTLPIYFKIYILKSNFSLNIYDGSWHIAGGSNQISIGITAPSDTTKLFLDITSTTNPILKYYSGTSWVNVSSTQIQSDWNQTDTTKSDYIKGKPTSTPTQIDNSVTNSHNHSNKTYLDKINEDSNGKLTYNGNAMGGDSTSLKGINIDDSTRSNGRVLTYNNSTNTLQYADVNISGIVGSSQITTISNTTIPSGNEITFNHPNSTSIIPVIEEQIAGSSVTDTHVDFSDASKYILQDNGKIYFGNNKIQLNICSWNSLDKGTGATLSNNNLTVSQTGTNGLNYSIRADKFVTKGKWYWETKINSYTTTASVLIGVANNNFIVTSDSISNSNQISYFAGGTLFPSSSAYGSSYTTGDIIGVALDVDNKIIKFSKNGVWFANITLPTWSNYYPFLTFGTSSSSYSTTTTTNFGASAFIYTIPTNFYPIGLYTNATPTYLQTTGSSDYSLTTIDTISSLAIPVTLSSSATTIKCLFSVDNKTNWLYYNGTTIQKFTGTMTNDWGSTSSSYTQLQTYFNNKTITSLTSDLSSLGIVPISLDFCFQLNSTDLTQTPSLSPITMVYIAAPHNEFASVGTFSDSSTYGVKRVSNSSLSVKNKSAVTKIIKLNVITST